MSDAAQQLHKTEEIFHEAVDLGDAERESLIAERCGGDAELSARVRRMVAACRRMEEITAALKREPAEEDTTRPAATRIGPYALDRLLGRGGMGAVYLAHRADGEFEQQVAIKVIGLPLETEEFRQRFRQERQILAKLNHPNLTRLLDGGITGDGELYIVMEYIDGVPIDRFPASLDRKLNLFRDVCAAVEWAHQNLIVHRDIKPSNILVDAEGTAKLLDFGAAKLMGDAAAGQTGFAMITPGYASPEQLHGEPATTLSDVFSLGAVLYELAAGEKAFGADLAGRLLNADGSLKLPCRLAGDVDQVVRKALATEPARRYASAGQLAEDVRRVQSGEPVLAHPPSVLYRTRRLLLRHWIPASLLAALIIVLTASSIYTYRQRNAARQEEMRINGAVNYYSSLMSGAAGVPKDATVNDLLYASARKLDSDAPQMDPQVEAVVRYIVSDAFENYGDLAAAQAQVKRIHALAASPGASARTRYMAAFAQSNLMTLEFNHLDEADAAAWQAYSIARRELGYDRETVNDALFNYLVRHRNFLIEQGTNVQEDTAGLIRKLVAGGCQTPSESCLDDRAFACLALTDSHFLDEGTAYCRQALDSKEGRPKDTETLSTVYWALAIGAEKREDWKLAVEYRRQYLDLTIAAWGASAPSSRFGRSALGRAEFLAGERETGFARTQAAVQEMIQAGGTPTSILPFFDLADLEARLDRGAEAEQCVRQALDLTHFPPSMRSHERMGEALAAQGKYEQAIGEFQAATDFARRQGDELSLHRLTGYLDKSRRHQPIFP